MLVFRCLLKRPEIRSSEGMLNRCAYVYLHFGANLRRSLSILAWLGLVQALFNSSPPERNNYYQKE